MKTIIVCVFGILAGLASAGITQAQWVAFNDHVAGTAAQTAANATTNDTRSAGGPYSLKEITTGTAIPGVQMTVTTSGGTPANGGTGGSLTGGPLYATFNTICYFGANLILISNSHLNTITFTGLNPSKRYKFMGGSFLATAPAAIDGPSAISREHFR